tara:strand:- start:2922 stop:3776 length:855 start_codon:yes stop_codon:yes gene_type:complete
LSEVTLQNAIVKHIKTHWAGRADFIWLVSLNLLGLRAAVHFVGGALKNAPIPIWLILFLLISVILIWQIIGSIRAAKSGLDHPDGIFKTIILFIAAMAVIITTTWQIGDQYHRLFDPIPEPFVDPAIITLPRSSDGGEVFLNGPITLKQYNAFRDIRDVNSLRTVTLDSQGGNIFAARGFHRLIVERGLNTNVINDCFSACTIIFIAGKNRTADPSARFGFHSYAYRFNFTGQQIDVVAEQTKDVARFQRINTPETFISKIFATPASEIWIPSRAELITANILN